MRNHGIFITLSTGLILLSSGTPLWSQSGDRSAAEAALDVLFELSQQDLAVRQRVVGVRLEGEAESSLSDRHPYRPLYELARSGKAAGYTQEIGGRWSAGEISAIAFADSLSAGGETERPFVAFYWAGSRGVRVNFPNNHSKLFPRFEAFDVQVWPQEFHGYVGVTPLAAMAAYARSTEMLHARELGEGSVRLRFPCNPDFSAEFLNVRAAEEVPWIELDVQLAPGPRIVRQAYRTELYGIHDEFVPTAWVSSAGRAIPAAFDYRINLGAYPDLEGDGFLTLEIEHELDPDLDLDGRAIFDLVRAVGFFATPETYLASRVGGDRLAQGAVDVLSGAAQWGAPSMNVDRVLREEVRSILAASRERIRAEGARWPGLSDDALLEHLVLPMAPFDMEERYCSQMGLTVLRRLAGEQVTFASILDAYPRDRLPVSDVVDCLEGGGLEYCAVRTESIEERCDDRPFLVFLGTDPEAGHLAVARKHEEGGFRVWSAPNELQIVGAGGLAGLSPLGVYVVPIDWSEGGSAGRFLAAACGAAALLLVVGVGLRRARRIVPAAGLLLAVSFALLAGCGRVEGGDVLLIESSQPEYRFDVQLNGSRGLDVSVRNATSGDVRIATVVPSCTCLVYRGKKELTLGKGESVRLPVSASGMLIGRNEEHLDVVAEAGGRTQALRIPILITTVGPLYTEPDVLHWRGPAGNAIEPFDVVAVTELDGAVGPLEWTVDLQGTHLRLIERGSSPSYAGTEHAFRLEGNLPDLDPGLYVANVEFTLPYPRGGGGEGVERLRKTIPVTISR